ncbi:MAG: mucoidy inhibitor MuiA family protein [Verrucomicrobiota bacterium]|nr:mucoidy inhibitor MuiA family protein [Verrucomicrobiota bacterium]
MNSFIPSFRNALLLGIALFATISADASVPAHDKITAVTVYADTAVVTRSGSAELPSGESEVVFENLPTGIQENSLRASGSGVSGLTILEVKQKTVYRTEAPNPRVAELQAQIHEMNKQDKVFLDQLETLRESKEFLKGVRAYYFESVKKPGSDDKSTGAKLLSTTEFKEIQTFLEKGTIDNQQETRKVLAEQYDLRIKAQLLGDELNKLGNGGGKNTVQVVVRVASPKASQATINIQYTLAGASWIPAYDARLNETDRTIDLSYHGIVRQNTGENWDNVALTLSTARPSLGATVPELDPWRVDVALFNRTMRQSYPHKEERSVVSNVVQMKSAEAASMADSFDAQAATASISANTTSASFMIPGSVTISSDNEPRKVGITSIKLAGTLQYQSVPKLNETAFLSAYLKNTSEYPLVAGEVSTFLGDSFVATSALETIMPGEAFQLPMGADEGISIKRKLVNKFTEDIGLTSKSERITYEYSIEVKNNKKTQERVMFKDNAPISGNEKIVVKLLEPAEKDASVTREADGNLVWRWDLKPGETRVAKLKFSVEYPKDIKVSGL